MSAPRLFVLGTGTGVGKTHTGATVLGALRARGAVVLGLKPVESGIDEEVEWETTDAGRLSLAAGHRIPPLHALVPPVSPHLAARRAGLTLETGEIVRWLDAREREAPELDLTWIETAGGVFSPLSNQEDNWSLARAASRPGDRWLLVAPDSLGVLHDCAATLLAMQARGRLPDALLLSQAREADASTGTNAEELRRMVLSRPGLEGIEPLGVMERAKTAAPELPQGLSSWLGSWLRGLEAL